MGHVPVSLHREKEIRRDRLRPFFKCLRFGQAIKGIVQFNRIKMVLIIIQLVLFPDVLRVEIAGPMFIVPARGVDMKEIHLPTNCKNIARRKEAGMIFELYSMKYSLGGGFNKPENTPIEPDLDNASEGSKKRFQGFWYKNMPKPFFFTALIYRGRPAIPARGGVGPGWYSPTARRSSRSSR